MPWPEPACGCPLTMTQPRTDCVSQGMWVGKPGARLANPLKGREGCCELAVASPVPGSLPAGLRSGGKGAAAPGPGMALPCSQEMTGSLQGFSTPLMSLSFSPGTQT